MLVRALLLVVSSFLSTIHCASPQDIDACMVIEPRSSCVEGFCQDLFWVSDAFDDNRYVFDSSGFLDKVFSPMTCAEAGDILGTEDPRAGPMSFNYEQAMSTADIVSDLMGGVWDDFQEDPFTVPSVSSFTSMVHLEHMVSVDEDSSVEERAAVVVLRTTDTFRAYSWYVESLVNVMSLEGFSLDMSRLRTFARHVVLVEWISGNSLLGAIEMTRRFLSNNEADAFSCLDRVPEISETEPERAVAMMESITAIASIAHETRLARLTGTLTLPIPNGQVEFLGIFWETLRAFVVSEVNGPCVILGHQIEKEICSQLEAVGEYVSMVAIWNSHLIAQFNHGIGLLVRICKPFSTPEVRIAVSGLFRGPIPVLAWPASVWALRSQQHANEVLAIPNVFLGKEIIPIFEGAEHVGYIGQRKQWISQLVDLYYRPGTEGGFFEKIWTFTDDSQRFITLKPDFDERGNPKRDSFLAVVAGRVMGMALKYDIPMGVSLAQSFLHGLDILASREEGIMDQLLEEEDPAFLQGIEWIGSVDWSSPPETIGWMNFDGLTRQGDRVPLVEANAGEFLRLSKLKRLFRQRFLGLQAFRDGLTQTVGAGIFSFLTPSELHARILPRPVPLSAEFLVRGMEFRNAPREDDPMRLRFIQTLERMSSEDLVLFHIFVTGVREPPITAESVPWIKVFFVPELALTALPRSHTCHNELQVPLYPTLEVMEAKFRTAIRETNTIEGYNGYNTNHHD
jgi:hypothetical protein